MCQNKLLWKMHVVAAGQCVSEQVIMENARSRRSAVCATTSYYGNCTQSRPANVCHNKFFQKLHVLTPAIVYETQKRKKLPQPKGVHGAIILLT